MKPSPITQEQFKKIIKALYYSASSGFIGGFILSLAGTIQSVDVATMNSTSVLSAIQVAAVVGGVVGALNSLAVTIKQIFTPAEL